MILHPQNSSTIKTYNRIISLVPSITELLYDLGLDDEVIAITKFCVHPTEWFINKTRIGGTKNININLINTLKPDLIIANKEENVKEQVEALAANFDVLVTDVNNLSDAVGMINMIGKLTGKETQALHLSKKIEKKFESLLQKTGEKQKINAAYLIWKEPYMVAGGGTFINDMIRYCGLANFFENVNRYPEINLAQLQKGDENMRQCNLIILSSEPYPFKEKHLQQIQLNLPEITVVLADGEMFSWYGSRLLKAADYFEAFQNKINLLFQK